jgi:hypothetical protein
VSNPARADGRRLGPDCPTQQKTQGHRTWGGLGEVERVKGIEPSLSAWESHKDRPQRGRFADGRGLE